MRAALLLVVPGCISVGGGVEVSGALNDRPVRRLNGGAAVGTFGQLLEERLVAQLTYGLDVVPLGQQAERHRAFGARLTFANDRGIGYYGSLAYGTTTENDPDASSTSVGVGFAYSRFQRGMGGWTWAATTIGLSYHRAHQDDIDLGRAGHFLGLELTIQAGYDRLGPLKQRPRP